MQLFIVATYLNAKFSFKVLTFYRNWIYFNDYDCDLFECI